MNNNYGEILFHVERAESGGRQDVTSISAIKIFWNRKYCVEFLDEIIIYYGKSENILARNLMIFLSSVDTIDVSRLWSIIHIDIVMLMCWLATCTHKMKEYGWGYIPMGKVLEKLKDNLNMIVYQPELIHDESFMMGIMDPWAAELTTFQDYMDHKLKQHSSVV